MSQNLKINHKAIFRKQAAKSTKKAGALGSLMKDVIQMIQVARNTPYF